MKLYLQSRISLGYLSEGEVLSAAEQAEITVKKSCKSTIAIVSITIRSYIPAKRQAVIEARGDKGKRYLIGTVRNRRARGTDRRDEIQIVPGIMGFRYVGPEGPISGRRNGELSSGT
jgi:hypothetical protein